VLAEVASLDRKRILDVGCGLADFAGFLKTRYREVQYVGVDISPKMIEEAKKLHPELDLRVQNVLVDDPGRFDFVLASGIFARLGRDAIPVSKKLISRMFECAEYAIAFNSLSAWAPNKEADEFYHDPLETLLFARSLSPWVVLRHDYHPRDFTIYVYRSASS
jgi:SAM-dependent methyltransferase